MRTFEIAPKNGGVAAIDTTTGDFAYIRAFVYSDAHAHYIGLSVIGASSEAPITLRPM